MNRGQFRGAIETLRGVASAIAAAAAAKLPLEVEQPRERRPAVLQEPVAAMWVRFRQAAQVAMITCQARRSSSWMA
jgi:hypothetical protein